MDSRHPEHAHVSKPMKAAIREGILLNLTTLLEVAHYFRNFGEAELTALMDKVRSLITLNLAELDTETANEALRMLGRYSGMGIGGRDAVILATMQMHGIKRILTHDRNFRGIREVRVIDPIPLKA